MLINDSGCYFLSAIAGPGGTPLMEFRRNPHMYGVKDWYDDVDVYFVEFRDGEAFDVWQLSDMLTPEFIDDIRDPSSRTHLMLSNTHEAFLSAVRYIYENIVIKQQIPAHKVILSTGAFNIEDEVTVISQQYKQDRIKTEISTDFECDAVEYYKHMVVEQGMVLPNTLQHQAYERKFLNFNRRWRPHRPTFVALLAVRDLLDEGFISLAHADDNVMWPDGFAVIEHMNYHFPQVLDQLLEHRSMIENLPPLYLDTTDLVTNRARLEESTNYYYENSYFSLISETNFYTSHSGLESSQFLSEKAFKCIIFKHPFILLSTPGTLAALRKLGYKTFSGLIDETYDTIENDADRLLAIVAETERLCKLNPEELTEWLTKAKEICDYNFDLLINKSYYTIRQF